MPAGDHAFSAVASVMRSDAPAGTRHVCTAPVGTRHVRTLVDPRSTRPLLVKARAPGVSAAPRRPTASIRSMAADKCHKSFFIFECHKNSRKSLPSGTRWGRRDREFLVQRSRFLAALKTRLGLILATAVAMRVMINATGCPAPVLDRNRMNTHKHLSQLIASAVDHDIPTPV